MNKFYTAQEVAERLKIKKTTVYELIKRGELASSKIGKQLRITEEQLEQYVQKSQPSPEPLHLPDFQPESSLLKRDYLLHSSGLILAGQTSPVLELLLSQISVHPNGIPVLQSHMNSYNSLYSLYFEKTHIASASLTLEEITHMVPGVPLTLLYLYDYPIGFYVLKGNPKNILSFSDFKRTDVILANREKGSTRRIYLDHQLKAAKIQTHEIQGYQTEMVSDLSTASAVISQKADVALGEEFTALQSPNLEFHFLEKLPMYLVMVSDSMEKPGFSALLEIVQSDDFKESLKNQTGYDTSHTGTLITL